MLSKEKIVANMEAAIALGWTIVDGTYGGNNCCCPLNAAVVLTRDYITTCDSLLEVANSASDIHEVVDFIRGFDGIKADPTPAYDMGSELRKEYVLP